MFNYSKKQFVAKVTDFDNRLAGRIKQAKEELMKLETTSGLTSFQDIVSSMLRGEITGLEQVKKDLTSDFGL